MPSAADLDCQTCGACCVSPNENRAEGFAAYVEVERGAPLLGKKDLVSKLVRVDETGTHHLRLDASGRCLALRGALGRRVSCAIYAVRPAACRRVERGASDCLRYRAERGL